MSNKMDCPGCNAYTSGVFEGVHNGSGCPYCGLSTEAIVAVTAARERHGETQLVANYEAALVRAEKAEREAHHLRSQLARIKSAVATIASEEAA